MAEGDGVLRDWVDGLAARARRALAPAVFDYVSTGSGRGASLDEATATWDAQRFRPRALASLGPIDTSTTLLGRRVSSPLGVAPVSLQHAADPDGEVAMAAGVADAGSLLVVPSNAGSRFADIGGTGVSWWLQLYLTAERHRCLPVVEAAVAAGAAAIVLTVDAPVVARKPGGADRVWGEVPAQWVRTNFGADADAAKAADLGPDDVTWLAEVSGVPIVVKGIVRGDDARRGVDAGAAAIWVSNHGGRQLDATIATARALPEVAAALGSSAEIYVDGGVRDAGHMLAACALGARAAFWGRPAYYALADGGRVGVAALHERAADEFAEVMTLAGVDVVDELDRSLIAPGDPS